MVISTARAQILQARWCNGERNLGEIIYVSVFSIYGDAQREAHDNAQEQARREAALDRRTVLS